MSGSGHFKKTALTKALNIFVYIFAGLFLCAIFLVVLVGYDSDKGDPKPVLERHFGLSDVDVTELQGGGLSWLEYKATLSFVADEFKPLVNMVVYEKAECGHIAELLKFNHPEFAELHGLDQVALSGDDNVRANEGAMNQDHFTCYTPTTDKIKKSYLLYDEKTGGHYFYIKT